MADGGALARLIALCGSKTMQGVTQGRAIEAIHQHAMPILLDTPDLGLM